MSACLDSCVLTNGRSVCQSFLRSVRKALACNPHTPPPIARRLVRYHLLDAVRGNTPPWSLNALRDVEVTLTVTAAASDRVDLRLSGHADMEEQGEWCATPPAYAPYIRDRMCCEIRERGYNAKLLGYLSLETDRGRFSRFDIVAVGIRWGGTTFNGRPDDTDPAPLGIAMTLAGQEARDRISPLGSPNRYFEA